MEKLKTALAILCVVLVVAIIVILFVFDWKPDCTAEESRTLEACSVFGR
jgi:hypothetical protein